MAVLITGIRLMTKTAIVISSTQIHQIQMAMAVRIAAQKNLYTYLVLSLDVFEMFLIMLPHI